MQPGQTVSPGQPPQNPTWQFSPDSQPQPQQTQPQQPQPVAPPPPPAPRSAPQAAVADANSVSWTASEFIAHAKSGGWYALLFLGALVVAAGVYFATKDKISTGVIVVVAFLFGISAARKPRELQYVVDDKAVSIGGKPYPYSGFRSFAIVQEGGMESIWFMPLKRFMPIVSIYFDPADGDKIVDILSQNLPIENRDLELVDRLMHRIRF